MKLERIVAEVEARLVEVGPALVRPTPLEILRREIDALTAELADRRTALADTTAGLRATEQRLSDNHTAAALLPWQIESSVRRGQSSQAFRQALELERIRQAIVADEAARPRLERGCESLQFHIRLLERRLTRLREQLRQR
jgi:hypothetical protein